MMTPDRRCPIGVSFADGRWVVDYVDLGDLRFSDPFYDETIQLAMRRPLNLAFSRRTPLDELPECDPDALVPSGFVFHLSRCGSTLVAQSLAASPEHLVLSEAYPIDHVVRGRRFDPAMTEADRVRRLRAIVGAFGRVHSGTERAFIVKLDAWHALDLALFERAFPNVPWVFVYRDPIAVMVSHARTPGMFLAAYQSCELIGISIVEAVAMAPEELHARILGRILEAVLVHGAPADALVAYDELPDAIEGCIVPRFNLSLSEVARTELRASFTRDAKRPKRTFVPDDASKRIEATSRMREAVERHMASPFAGLERIRCGRSNVSHAP